MRPATLQKWFRDGLRSTTMIWGADLASKSPGSRSSRASVGCAQQTSPIHEGPTSQLTGLLVRSWYQIPQHTFRGVTEPWSQQFPAVLRAKGDLHDIMQQVIMLWLISVHVNTGRSLAEVLRWITLPCSRVVWLGQKKRKKKKHERHHMMKSSKPFSGMQGLTALFFLSLSLKVFLQSTLDGTFYFF